jgi:hypothetical protein
MQTKTRVKVTENFFLDEFFDKETYSLNTEEDLRACLDMNFINDLQKLRTDVGAIFTINNWFTGGVYQWRGARNYKCKHYKAGSMHTCNVPGGKLKGLDFSAIIPAEKIRTFIKTNQKKYPSFRRLESLVNWVHVDTKETGVKTIIEFKP